MHTGAKAIIVGSGGQDGRLLGEALGADGYQVFGIARRSVVMPDGALLPAVDIQDRAAIADVVRAFEPDELYYLAAYHHSSEDEIHEAGDELLRRSREVHVDGFVNFLDAIRAQKNRASVFYAASSHVFGWPTTQPQSEGTPFDAQGAYGISKVEGIEAGRRYRDDYSLAVSCGILYNHESVYRRPGFVSRKLAEGAVAIIRAGQQGMIELGDLDARIDWGYAPDTVRAMRLMVGRERGDDYVVATGETHSIAEFAEAAFAAVGIDSWRDHVKVNPGLVNNRPRLLCGDSAKLRAATGWAPTLDFGALVGRLVSDYSELAGGLAGG